MTGVDHRSRSEQVMPGGDTSRLEIRTPEGVVYSLLVAGPVVRAAPCGCVIYASQVV